MGATYFFSVDGVERAYPIMAQDEKDGRRAIFANRAILGIGHVKRQKEIKLLKVEKYKK